MSAAKKTAKKAAREPRKSKVYAAVKDGVVAFGAKPEFVAKAFAPPSAAVIAAERKLEEVTAEMTAECSKLETRVRNAEAALQRAQAMMMLCTLTPTPGNEAAFARALATSACGIRS